MKAIDYFEEYGEAVLRESLSGGDSHEALSRLYLAFVREMKEIIASRGVKTDRGAVAVISEQNQKWNALCALYAKKYSEDLCPLKRDGIMNSMKDKVPEMARYLEGKV